MGLFAELEQAPDSLAYLEKKLDGVVAGEMCIRDSSKAGREKQRHHH